MDDFSLCTALCKTLALGDVINPPRRVSGGFSHKMFRVDTAGGCYALKLLNPAVMRRTEALQNYRRAERLEEKLRAAGLPVVPACSFGGRKMQQQNGRYFYLFPWIDGEKLTPETVTETHCAIMGDLLARMHSVEKGANRFQAEKNETDWNAFLPRAESRAPRLFYALKEAVPFLTRLTARSHAFLDRIPGETCICNGDMDIKNVLWTDGQPHIIDLECLTYGSPAIELFELALSWSGYERCKIDETLLCSFLSAYLRRRPVRPDWAAVYACDTGRLDWLAYNLERALSEESDPEEAALGLQQAEEALCQLRYYDRMGAKLLETLRRQFD